MIIWYPKMICLSILFLIIDLFIFPRMLHLLVRSYFLSIYFEYCGICKHNSFDPNIMCIICIYYLYLFYVATPHNNSFQKRKVVFQRNTFHSKSFHHNTQLDQGFSHSLLNDENAEAMGSNMQQ